MYYLCVTKAEKMTQTTKIPTDILVKMYDMLNDKCVARIIDISNFTIYNNGNYNVLNDASKQAIILNQWIEERANEQHNTWLELKGWKIIYR